VRLPLDRSSMTSTSHPCERNRSNTFEPMNPAPPVIKARRVIYWSPAPWDVISGAPPLSGKTLMTPRRRPSRRANGRRERRGGQGIRGATGGDHGHVSRPNLLS